MENLLPMNDISDNKLTHENKDEFIVWVWNQFWERSRNISEEHFNILLTSNIDTWISEYMNWGYCYNLILDQIKEQTKMEKEMEEINEKERVRPTDIKKRRELLASMYENKFKKENKKYNAR